ncbi:DMT family transporter [Desulfogranum mediterraneum]|uniref:DMT family transporter n=1 Tax=Desulfogranum mediterraneum TaxID=160661 RepID=UPI00041C3A6D|nr:DMT family transporter [Desulfogranum mediterraneum]
MNPEVQSMTPYEWLLLIVLSIFLGGSFFFVGVAVEALPPLTIVALRVGLAALALLVVVQCSGLRLPRSRSVWLAFFGMGLLNNVLPFTLIVWGQTQIASGLAAILNATTPLFTVIAAHFLTRDERLSRLKFFGVAIGLGGVIIMIGQETLLGIGEHGSAQLAVLAAAVSYALAGIYGRRFKRLGVQPLVTASGQVTASTIMLFPVALVIDTPFSLPMPGGQVWAALAGLAMVSTALAYLIYFRILAGAGATNVLLVTLLVPVSAILLGGVFLGEQLEPQHYLGMGLISIGLLAIDGRLWTRLMAIRPGQSVG